jgi:hypothetical protein
MYLRFARVAHSLITSRVILDIKLSLQADVDDSITPAAEAADRAEAEFSDVVMPPPDPISVPSGPALEERLI